MNFANFTASPIVQNLGWTLLHSIWQIAFVWLWLFLSLKICRRAPANVRYSLACAALGLALLLPLATFVSLFGGGTRSNYSDSISNPKNPNLPARENRKAENYPPAEAFKAESARVASESFFASFENWQNRFENYFTVNLPILVWLWLAGVVVFAARTTGGLWQLRLFRNRKIKAASDEWQNRFADLRRRVGVARSVRLCESLMIQTPVVIGWLKPIVLIPASAFCGMNPQQLETIIVHELVHLRRHDYLVNLLQTGIEILLFYHPGAWWISRKIRSEREFACDRAVVRFYGEPLVYARALAQLEIIRQLTNETSPRLTVAANGGKLMNRIEKILQKETETRGGANSLWSALLACALISAFVLAIFSFGERAAVNAESRAKTKKMAFGFVSIPPVDRMGDPPKDSDATARLLIEKLNSHRVPAIGFLNGVQISNGEKLFPVQAEIVRMWRDAGFEIGIGNFRHIKFYDTPFDQYAANAEKNAAVAKQILAEKNLPLRYFSYPYLNTGKTAEDKQRFENWLRERGLRSVKYTFDNQEWMYSYAYDQARLDNDVPTMKQIRAEYLDYMIAMLDHFEAYSTEMFGRDIAQTTVLTPSRLVTDTADEFFGMLKARGYEFVPMDEAQGDEAYKSEENFAGDSGISWFERWTMRRGGRLRDEPRVSRTVWKIWNERKAAK